MRITAIITVCVLTLFALATGCSRKQEESSAQKKPGTASEAVRITPGKTQPVPDRETPPITAEADEETVEEVPAPIPHRPEDYEPPVANLDIAAEPRADYAAPEDIGRLLEQRLEGLVDAYEAEKEEAEYKPGDYLPVVAHLSFGARTNSNPAIDYYGMFDYRIEYRRKSKITGEEEVGREFQVQGTLSYDGSDWQLRALHCRDKDALEGWRSWRTASAEETDKIRNYLDL